MGANLVLRIFIFTIVSILCAGTSGHSKRISHFRVLRKHKHIKECANFVLSYKNDYIGGRVSDTTGVCEGLSYSLKWNQSVEAEYSYFMGMSTLKTFVPPIDVREDGYSLAIPGTFDTGARLELYVTMFEKNADQIEFTITEASNIRRGITLWLESIINRVYFSEISVVNPGGMIGLPHSFQQSTNQIQITFVAQKNSMQLFLHPQTPDKAVLNINLFKLLVDEQKLLMIELEDVRLDSLKHVTIHTSKILGQHALILHRFEFREA